MTEQERFDALKRQFDSKKAVRDSQLAERESRVATLAALDARIDALTKAREVIMLVGKNTQQALEYRISSLVSLALATVFDDPYEFQVKFVERRNAVEVDFSLTRDGHEYDILDGTGGGVGDVVSFALRAADWKLRGGRPTMFLDEQFRNVWPAGQPKVSLLLKKMSHDLGLQILLVSHQNRVNEAADKTLAIEDSTLQGA